MSVLPRESSVDAAMRIARELGYTAPVGATNPFPTSDLRRDAWRVGFDRARREGKGGTR